MYQLLLLHYFHIMVVCGPGACAAFSEVLLSFLSVLSSAESRLRNYYTTYCMKETSPHVNIKERLRRSRI
jgi:hypothetical protein